MCPAIQEREAGEDASEPAHSKAVHDLESCVVTLLIFIEFNNPWMSPEEST